MDKHDLKVFLIDYYNNRNDYYLISILRYFRNKRNIININLNEELKDDFKKNLENLEWYFMLDDDFNGDCHIINDFNKTIKKIIDFIEN